MDEVQRKIIASILKEAGFDNANQKALEILLNVFEDRLTSFLHASLQKSIHAGRPSMTMLDILDSKQCFQKLLNYRPWDKSHLLECRTSAPKCSFKNNEDMFSLVPLREINLEYELLEPEVEWSSPLSTHVEKFIHIYDFMPSFPPIHTFRMTALKSQSSKNQSSKVKNRLEQSLRSESNMIKLIKTNGSIPGFINYMYRNKK